MDILGDAVMKHVACRVTVDGTLPEASPVEAPLIQISHIIHTLEQAGTREGPATCNTAEGKPICSVRPSSKSSRGFTVCTSSRRSDLWVHCVLSSSV